jgi:SIS domain
MISEISAQLQDHRNVIEKIERELSPLIAQMTMLMVDSFKHGGKLLVMGNGGSAADSQHFVAEIVGRFKMERRGLPAVALSTDTSILRLWPRPVMWWWGFPPAATLPMCVAPWNWRTRKAVVLWRCWAGMAVASVESVTSRWLCPATTRPEFRRGTE